MEQGGISRASELLRALELQTERRIEELQSLLLLRPGVGSCDEVSKLLEEALENVESVEACIREVAAHAKRETKALQLTTGIMSRALKQGGRIDHIQENVPKHLPNCHPNATRDRSVNQLPAKEVVPTPSPIVEATKGKIRPPIPQIPFLTASELKAAPQYLRGRLTLEKVNSTVEVLNRLLKDKYLLLRRPMRELTSEELNAVQDFHEQDFVEGTNGEAFISSADIRGCDKLRPDSLAKGVLSLLRHFKRVREVRGAKGLRLYIIASSIT
eukprot:Plantae.Rhodophyta-Purpureofilum_apyrenoidigerum.ctg23840.p1 GENE.Plantae.Rhodophyta-Purpureofilum_apyrenoidigerum.ctg23840~~Plantae.Rhodophyta-Purpureofilum_apyrenoidigerum.ctg23840.p1  ORF type:complete len:292 (-),score=49.97 Plantae.Rhodophyta-Purpureofilum_apyrenoidigerum.ctg23840:657-1469(-)